MTARPTSEGAMVLPDGRRLTFASFGPADGRPVLGCHGNPGSRLMCPDPAALEAAQVRLLVADRPGMGGSDPRPLHTLGDAADDLVALADHLGLAQVGVFGWSAGSHFALGLAACHPDRVTGVVLAGAPGAPDDPVTADARAAQDTLLEQLAAGSLAAFEQVVDRFADIVEEPDRFLHLTLANEADPDRRLMLDETNATALTVMWRESVRQGATGLASSWCAQYALGWGFTPEQVTVPVRLWHGSGDVITPLAPAERLAARLPAADLTVVSGAGHLVPVEHFSQMLRAL